jgi:glycosyltransferase involved in cell wall biosynthesis/cytochrome c-type biogenesis protein CcmH/NrfG
MKWPDSYGREFRRSGGLMTIALPMIMRPRLRDLIRAADTARDRKDWQESVRLYEQVVRATPSSHRFLVQLGHAYKEAGDFDNASRTYQSALQAVPEDDDLHVQIGHLEKLRGNLSEAVAAYMKAMQLNPANADAIAEYARAAGILGLPALHDPIAGGVGSVVAKALTKTGFSGSAESLLRQANRARDEHAWAMAAAAYRTYLAMMPDDAAIWVQYGHAEKEQGLLAYAETAYRRAVALDATVADTHLQLGHVLKLQDRLDEAVDEYLVAHQLEPKSTFVVSEFEALWPEVPGLKFRDFPTDRKFTDAVYGSAVQSPQTSRLAYRSDHHLLFLHWISDDLLGIFDPLYYFHANPMVATALEKPDRHRCLVHFCEVGIKHLLPCAEATVFDPEFYNETYLGDRPLSPQTAYRHWLNTGRRNGYRPNKLEWMNDVLGIDKATVGGIDLDSYVRSAGPDDVARTWANSVQHFVDTHVLETRWYLPITLQTADFFSAIADRFARRGDDDSALMLYERVLADVPDHQPSTLNRADSLRRSGSVLELLRVHQDLIQRRENTAWSYHHLATGYQRLGNLQASLRCLYEGTRTSPGDRSLRDEFSASSELFILSEWQEAVALARLGRVAEAQELVRNATEFVTSLIGTTESLPQRPIRAVAIVSVEISPQCQLYRIDQKVEHIRAAGYDVTVYTENQLGQYLGNIYRYDAVIFYRIPALAPLIAAIARSRTLGLTTYYDIDDLLFTNDFPDSFESYGGLIRLDEHIGLRLGIPLYHQAIALCDYGIASTAPLAVEMAKLTVSGKAFVHRNAFSEKHELYASSMPEPHAKGQVVIFYGSGTKAHGEDFEQLVVPALIEMVNRYGDRIKIVLAGYVIITELLASIRDNLEILDINWEIDEYWAVLRSADINIAVLKQSHMTDCKSEIKWMEAAMLGVPSVVSNTSTYREVIEPRVTGLLCDTTEEWVSALDLLIRDDALRYRMGLKAWQRVRHDYGIEASARNIDQIFNECKPAREAPEKPVVLIVNVFYPPQAIGGATRVVHDNVRHLSARYRDDFKIEVFTSTHGGREDYKVSCYTQDGVRVTALDRPTDPSIEAAIYDDRIEQIFGAYLDETRPSVIHFHCIQRLTTSIVTAADKRRIPYLITVHDGWWISSHHFAVDEHSELSLYNFKDPLSVVSRLGKMASDRMAALRRPLAAATKILAVSNKFAELYRQCGVDNVVSIPNGVSDLPARKRTESRDGRVRLAFIGGMHRIKGHHLIKYAFLNSAFQKLSLTMVDDSLRKGQSRRSVWNGTPVNFIAKVPEERVDELYAEIDVLLAPSIWPESFGLVTREAIHFGCWVVTSDRGSIGDDIIDGVNGHLIDVSDASALIHILTMIDGNPQRYLNEPPAVPLTRRASGQADDLAALYKEIIADARPNKAEKHQGRTRWSNVADYDTFAVGGDDDARALH